MAVATRDRFEQRVQKGLENRQVRKTVARVQDYFKTVRARAFDDLGDVARWRQRAEEIRHHTMENLDAYLEQFAEQVKAKGGHVHFAPDAEAARRTVLQVAQQRGVRRIVKGKSMVTEEIRLNDALDGAGMDVVETDLGEFIVQLAKERPFHIVGPAIHKNRAQIAALFSALAGKLLSDEPEALTRFAREYLRDKFFQADMGITGCNFAIAESGSVVLFSNEGNIRMTTTLPPVHVVVMGMERVVPTWEDLDVLLTLLPRSITGQKTSSYISAVNGPRQANEADGPEEWHVVIVDNGRSRLLGTRYQKALHCIRCGTCSLVCPVYRHIGGHAYGSVYNGPIGSIITPLMNPTAGGDELPFASSLCGACSEACPVNIPLHEYLVELRADGSGSAPWAERTVARLFGWGTARAPAYRMGQRMIGWLAGSGSSDGYVSKARGPLALWTAYRDLPQPVRETFLQWWKARDKEMVRSGLQRKSDQQAPAREDKSVGVGQTVSSTDRRRPTPVVEEAVDEPRRLETPSAIAQPERGVVSGGRGTGVLGEHADRQNDLVDELQDVFLQQLAKRLGRSRRRPEDVQPLRFVSHPWDDFYVGKSQADFIDRFCATLEEQGGRVWWVRSHEEWRQRLTNWLREKQVRHVILARDARLERLGLPELLQDAAVTWHIWQQDDVEAFQPQQRWSQLAEQAQVGITWADAALSETGTVVQFSSAGTGRSVSLLPETHLVFLYAEQIEGRLSDLTRRLSRLHRQGLLPTAVNLISGPSSSADIEMQIVKGVHGPREMVVVVLDGEDASAGGAV